MPKNLEIGEYGSGFGLVCLPTVNEKSNMNIGIFNVDHITGVVPYIHMFGKITDYNGKVEHGNGWSKYYESIVFLREDKEVRIQMPIEEVCELIYEVMENKKETKK